MKTSKGFVAAVSDGSFVIITHEDEQIKYTLTDDIENASVYFSPNFSYIEHRELDKLVVTWLPVTVKREVILNGYGVPK